MYTPADKSIQNKIQSAANSVTQKRSSNKGYGFIDNRPEATAQRKLQELSNEGLQDRTSFQLKKVPNQQYNTPLTQNKPNISGITTSTTIQLNGEKLRDKKFKKPPAKLAAKLLRTIKNAAVKEGWEENTKRNIFVARFISKFGKKRYNYVLKSAGMGGKHPIGLNDRTAAHTEPQLAALLANPKFVKKKIQKNLGKNWKLDSIFSSNKPCSSKGGGTKEGCGGMSLSDMGEPNNFFSTSSENYKGGNGPTFKKVKKMLDNDEDDKLSVGSVDSYLPEDMARNHNLTDIDF